MKRRWYPVRCCCDGSRILGFIALPEGQKEHRVTISPRTATYIAEFINGPRTKVDEPELATLRILYWHGGGSHVGSWQNRDEAVYGDGQDIEFWRRVPGFVEVAQGEDFSGR